MKRIVGFILLSSLFYIISDSTKESIIHDTLRERINLRSNVFSCWRLNGKMHSSPPFRSVFYWRVRNDKVTNEAVRSLEILIVKFLTYIYKPLDTIEISPTIGNIGKDLYVTHGYCIINANSIGEHVAIHQGVTIGKDHKTGKRPTIGNNVVIMPNAVIVGDIAIGDNVYVGANTFVNFSIPPNTTVKSLKPRVERYRG